MMVHVDGSFPHLETPDCANTGCREAPNVNAPIQNGRVMEGWLGLHLGPHYEMELCTRGGGCTEMDPAEAERFRMDNTPTEAGEGKE